MNARPALNWEPEDDGVDAPVVPETPTRDLNSALLQAENALHDFAPDLPISFHFGWQDRLVRCRIDSPAESPVLHLSVDLAALPFTAEQPHRRTQLIDAALKVRSAPGRIVLTRSQRLEYRINVAVTPPLHGKAIITAIAHALLCGAGSAAVAFAT